MEVCWIEGQGYDSNIYLIKDEINVLIDSGTGLRFDKVRRKINKFGVKLNEIDMLVNTHCHFDHTGGDYDFLKVAGCELLASEFAAEMLESGDGEVTLADMFGSDLDPLEVSRVIDEGDEIDIGKAELEVLYTPGHSKGSISIYEPTEKVLFPGDVVFRSGVGRTDLPSSDKNAMRESLKRLDSMDIEKIYSGHGPVADGNAGRSISMALRILG